MGWGTEFYSLFYPILGQSEFSKIETGWGADGLTLGQEAMHEAPPLYYVLASHTVVVVAGNTLKYW